MIRVLIVDDSAVVRRVLTAELSRTGDIEVVGTAADPYIARDKILKLWPDVLTLDLQMPRMDGLTFLAKLMKFRPLPVVVISALTPAGSAEALRAMELGAIGVIAKKSFICPGDRAIELLRNEIRVAAARISRRPAGPPTRKSRPKQAAKTLEHMTHRILAIGGSTGGVTAIEAILANLPPNTPGTVIAEHMPGQFSTTFANRLNEICPMTVREARDHDTVVPGVALVAPDGLNMEVRRSGERYIVKVADNSPQQHPRPHIDALFNSVASHAGPNAVGVILTGMGADGARGLLAMRRAGARTLAQDEASSVVFGMPKEAIRIGAAERVVSLKDMPTRIVAALSAKKRNGPNDTPRATRPEARQLDRAVSNRTAPGG